jgi:PKD repeat protein
MIFCVPKNSKNFSRILKWKMKKIIILLLILFISFIYTASSLKTFEVDETEKLSLGLETEDPDAEKLVYTFTEPLDGNGEWQTTYGDAGEYKSTITVSDGVSEVSEEILIIINRKEAEPVIDSFIPEEDFVAIDEGNSVKFEVVASDLNNDELIYKWIVNGEVASDSNGMLFQTDYEDSGEYTVKLTISDGTFDVSKEWNVDVNNVDLDSILEQIGDITILETEKASLELPDFEKYGLSYSISDPIGNDNIWKTGYDDAGDYTVKITAEGSGFKGEKEVKIIVRERDRAPKFVDLNDAKIKENEEIRIELKALDPDNDDITLSVENIPENAKLDGNIFTFNPGYDFVQKNNVFDYILDKFRILSRSVNIIFTAQSNDLKNKKTVRITVKDVNRPFTLENIDDIEINEGDEIVIDPKYNDPDNDKVSFSYSGFMNRDNKKTGFDDAGEYVVKIVATDDYFTETKFIDVKVNDVNRKPVFDMIDNFEVKEGNKLRIELNAADPDNDAVSFSAEEMHKGAQLKDNLFVWKPGFIVNGTKKEFSVDFIASDGVNEVSQKVKITVLNVNQAPEIIDYSDNLIVLKDKPVLFEVNAVDLDGDDLTYSWNFGFFNKLEGTNQHQRIFTTTDKKKVEVVVSDGIESVSKVWNVEVV